MRWHTVALVAVLLSGCSTQVQRAIQESNTQGRAAAAEAQACVLRIADTPAYRLVDSRAPIATKPSLQQLADTSQASPEEVKAFFEVRNHTDGCRDQLVKSMTGVNAAFIPALSALYVRSDRNAVDLVQRRISWGAYNQRRMESAAEYERDITAIGASLNRDLAQSHDAELQRRQAAANALQQLAYQQQVLSALNRPTITTTSCGAFGNTLNCTSVGR